MGITEWSIKSVNISQINFKNIFETAKHIL